MKRLKSTKPSAANALLPLVPLGAAAVVAGCSGGGNSTPQTTPQNEQTPGKPAYATTTAMLTITIPARSKTAQRRPDYISQGSAALGVSVSPASGPSAAPTYFPLPPPGPNPTTTTLPVTAPLGTDTVAVDIYDALPSATAAPNLLSEGTTTATIATGSTALDVHTLGVAQGVEFRKGSATSEEVLQNDASAQTAALTATPLDADGYAITGTLAHPVPLSAPAGVTLSPATLTAAGTVDATYAASQSSTGGRITAGLPLDTKSGSTDNFTIAATQYVFVASDDGESGTLTVIDPLERKIVATTPLAGNGPYGIAAMAGCAGGETAVVAWGGTSPKTLGFTVAPPGSSSAPASEDFTSLIAPRAAFDAPESPSYLASDAKCGLYSANDKKLHRYSGFPAATGAAIPSSGWTANSSVADVNGTLYGITITSDPEIQQDISADVQSVPAAGGRVTDLGYIFQETPEYEFGNDFGIEVGGVYCYEANYCDGGFNINSIPGFVQSESFLNGGQQLEDFAVSPNNTVYLAFGNGSSGRYDVRRRQEAQRRGIAPHAAPAAERHPADVISGTPPPEVSMTADGVGVSADGRYIAVGVSAPNETVPARAAGAPDVPSVQIYAASSTPGGAPTALGTPMPLPSAAPNISRVVFPR